jgi:hypothetical protein
MRIAKSLCVLVMVVALLHFVQALHATGTALGLGMDTFLAGYFGNPWQAVIDIDLMLGLLMVCVWMFWRESDRAVGLTWIFVLLWWGNLILAIYLCWQMQRSGGDWARVFIGDRVPGGRATPPALPATLRALLVIAAIGLSAFATWGCWQVQFALVPTIGYVSGIGSLALAAAMIAFKTARPR